MTIAATTTERTASKANSNQISRYMDAMQIEINLT